MGCGSSTPEDDHADGTESVQHSAASAGSLRSVTPEASTTVRASNAPRHGNPLAPDRSVEGPLSASAESVHSAKEDGADTPMKRFFTPGRADDSDDECPRHGSQARRLNHSDDLTTASRISQSMPASTASDEPPNSFQMTLRELERGAGTGAERNGSNKFGSMSEASDGAGIDFVKVDFSALDAKTPRGLKVGLTLPTSAAPPQQDPAVRARKFKNFGEIKRDRAGDDDDDDAAPRSFGSVHQYITSPKNQSGSASATPTSKITPTGSSGLPTSLPPAAARPREPAGSEHRTPPTDLTPTSSGHRTPQDKPLTAVPRSPLEDFPRGSGASPAAVINFHRGKKGILSLIARRQSVEDRKSEPETKKKTKLAASEEVPSLAPSRGGTKSPPLKSALKNSASLSTSTVKKSVCTTPLESPRQRPLSGTILAERNSMSSSQLTSTSSRQKLYSRVQEWMETVGKERETTMAFYNYQFPQDWSGGRPESPTKGDLTMSNLSVLEDAFKKKTSEEAPASPASRRSLTTDSVTARGSHRSSHVLVANSSTT